MVEGAQESVQPGCGPGLNPQHHEGRQAVIGPSKPRSDSSVSETASFLPNLEPLLISLIQCWPRAGPQQTLSKSVGRTVSLHGRKCQFAQPLRDQHPLQPSADPHTPFSANLSGDSHAVPTNLSGLTSKWVLFPESFPHSLSPRSGVRFPFHVYVCELFLLLKAGCVSQHPWFPRLFV